MTSLRQVAAWVRPAWFVIPPPVGEPIMAVFRGPWRVLYVTERWVYLSSTGSGLDGQIRLDEIADVRAGVDPSPSEDGPIWGIRIVARHGGVRLPVIWRAFAARALIAERAGLPPSSSG